MARREGPLDGTDPVLLEFARGLRDLRTRAGLPTFREMAASAHFSYSALSEAAKGRKLPSLEVTRGFVRACDGDVAEWERRWRAAHAAVTATAVAADRTPGDGHDAGPVRECPYPGLAPYRETDADRFFGREQVVDDLAALLRAGRFVAVFGPSGSGKSSVLRAGLIPRLAGQAHRVLLFTPGPRPWEECAAHLADILNLPASALATELGADPANLSALVRQVSANQPDAADVVLVIDQFEELFTLCQDATERHAFIAGLMGLVDGPGGPARVVLGVRADFYGHCAQHPDLVRAVRDRQVLLGPMSADELRRAVTEPAKKAGLVVETALVTQIVADTVGRDGALPLMSHALAETCRRPRGTTLTYRAYDAAGGVAGALVRTADTVYTAFTPAEQRHARDLLLRLIEPGEETEDTRRRIRATEIDRQDSTALTVLAALTDARLVTLDQDTVEIAHEALIRSWPRLQTWIEQDRDRLRAHRRVTDAAHRWAEADRDPGLLLTGPRIESATDCTAHETTAPSPLEREFVTASRALARRRRRRRRALVALGVILVVVAVTTSIVAIDQRADAIWQRNITLARILADRAQNEQYGTFDTRELLAAEAFRQAPIEESRSALLAVQSDQSRGFGYLPDEAVRGITRHTPSAAAFSGDGQILAVAVRSSLCLWSVVARRCERPVTLPDRDIVGVALRREGTELWSLDRARGASDTTPAVLRRWNTATLTSRVVDTTDTAGSFSIAVSRDGRELALGGDGQLSVMDTGTGRVTYRRSTPPGPVRGIALLPDGSPLSGHRDGTIHTWDRATGADRLVCADPGGEIASVSVADNGDDLVYTTGGMISTIMRRSEPDHRLSAGGGPMRMSGSAITPAGDLIATVISNVAVQFSDRANNTLTGRAVTVAPRAAGYSADGAIAALSDTGRDVRLLDTGSRHDIGALQASGKEATEMEFTSGDREIAALNTDRSITVWDRATRTIITTIPSAPATPVAAGDATATPTALRASLVRLGRTPPDYDPGDGTVAVSADHARRVIAGNGEARLIDTEHDPTTLPMPDEKITSAAFSTDNRRVALGTRSGKVVIWDLATTTVWARLTTTNRPITRLAFTPDNTHLITGAAGTASNSPRPGDLIWNLDETANLERICRNVNPVEPDTWESARIPLPYTPICTPPKN